MFEKLIKQNHEDVHYFYDKETDLKSIVAIHNTTLGPAMGGVRIWDYKNDEEALEDVLRLSEGMTFKCAAADINMGGGKAVIIGDVKKVKNKKNLKKFGQFVNKLGGNYITAPDVNTDIYDVEIISQETSYTVGLPKHLGGSDDPSEFTAFGVFMGIKAAVKKIFNKDNLENISILVEGAGKVGTFLIKNLIEEKAKIYVSDISLVAQEAIKAKYNVSIVDASRAKSLDIDVYSPCALGKVLNSTTIPNLNCKIVAGAANNQLENSTLHAEELYKRNILYIPDFIINSGGLYNVYNEYIGNYSRTKTFQTIKEIYNKCLKLFDDSVKAKTSLNNIAVDYVLEKLKKNERECKVKSV